LNEKTLVTGKLTLVTVKPTLVTGKLILVTVKPTLVTGKLTLVTVKPTLVTGNWMTLKIPRPNAESENRNKLANVSLVQMAKEILFLQSFFRLLRSIFERIFAPTEKYVPS
jgi:hypothetical protein